MTPTEFWWIIWLLVGGTVLLVAGMWTGIAWPTARTPMYAIAAGVGAQITAVVLVLVDVFSRGVNFQ